MLGSVQPVALVEPYLPEQFYLAAHRRYTGSTFCAPVAAKRSVVRLRNPSDSGALVIVDSLLASTTGANNAWGVAIHQPSADLAQNPPAGGVRTRDTRETAPAQARLSYDQEPPGIPQQNLLWAYGGAYAPQGLEDVAVVLGPGWAVDFVSDIVNIPLLVSVRWRERALYDLEA